MGIDDDPSVFGCEEVARGFPYLRAMLEPPAVGYGDILGWVQLVDMSDRAEEASASTTVRTSR